MKVDLLEEGNFGDAIQGVDGVFHIASPKTPIDPCINGTLNVLNSCNKAPTLKRLVLTSSCFSIRYREDAQQPEECGIDLVVVNPSFVVGPLLAPRSTKTLLIILGMVKGMLGECPNGRFGFFHIEEVVAAHILVMEEQKASVCDSQEGEDIPYILDTDKITQLGHPPLKSLTQMFDDCIRSFQEKGFL
ncbi:unnamed protein product [Withania somnifera]